MTNAIETKTRELMAERDEQRASGYLDDLAVADAMGMAVRRACCLEALAASVLEGMDKALEGYRLSELLAMDVSVLAVEIEAIRDDLEDAAHGMPNRFTSRD